jgi:hypothetical protein
MGDDQSNVRFVGLCSDWNSILLIVNSIEIELKHECHSFLFDQIALKFYFKTTPP